MTFFSKRYGPGMRSKHVRSSHDDVIKWKHFPRYWQFVQGIHRSPVNSPHKGQWRGTLMFSLIYARINDWVNNRQAGDLRRRLAHYDATVMILRFVAIILIFENNFSSIFFLYTGQRNTELSVINWNRSIQTELTNTNAADALVPCIARPPAMMLNLQDT